RKLRLAELRPPRRIGGIIPELVKCGGYRLLDPRTATRRHTTLRAGPLHQWMRFGSCLSGSGTQVESGRRRSRGGVIAAAYVFGNSETLGTKGEDGYDPSYENRAWCQRSDRVRAQDQGWRRHRVVGAERPAAVRAGRGQDA